MALGLTWARRATGQPLTPWPPLHHWHPPRSVGKTWYSLWRRHNHDESGGKCSRMVCIPWKSPVGQSSKLSVKLIHMYSWTQKFTYTVGKDCGLGSVSQRTCSGAKCLDQVHNKSKRVCEAGSGSLSTTASSPLLGMTRAAEKTLLQKKQLYLLITNTVMTVKCCQTCWDF